MTTKEGEHKEDSADRVFLENTNAVKLFIKHFNVHEGHWALAVNFGITALNTSLDGPQVSPTVAVSVKNVGLFRTAPDFPDAVDAAEYNPIENTSPDKKSRALTQKKAKANK